MTTREKDKRAWREFAHTVDVVTAVAVGQREHFREQGAAAKRADAASESAIEHSWSDFAHTVDVLTAAANAERQTGQSLKRAR